MRSGAGNDGVARVALMENSWVEAGDGVVGGDEAGALGDGDEGAEVVEEIDEEEDEDDFEQTLAESAADVEFEGGVGEGVKASGGRGPAEEVLRPD